MPTAAGTCPPALLLKWPREDVMRLKEAITQTGLSGDATAAGRLEPMLRKYLSSAQGLLALGA